MKIEIGKFYRCRSGAKAQILVEYCEQIENHFIGIVMNSFLIKKEVIPMSWEKNGNVYGGTRDQTEWDLVAPWEEPMSFKAEIVKPIYGNQTYCDACDKSNERLKIFIPNTDTIVCSECLRMLWACITNQETDEI